MFLQMVLPAPGSPPVRAIGEVVRAKRDIESGKLDVAVHFTTVAEADRDQLINYVFQRHYEQLGNQIGAEFEPDD